MPNFTHIGREGWKIPDGILLSTAMKYD